MRKAAAGKAVAVVVVGLVVAAGVAGVGVDADFAAVAFQCRTQNKS